MKNIFRFNQILQWNKYSKMLKKIYEETNGMFERLTINFTNH